MFYLGILSKVGWSLGH